MKSSFQPRALHLSGILRTGQLWLRLASILTVLILTLASTAQVCHVHEQFAPHGKQAPQGPSLPDHCPLCVAMHSALPSSAGSAQGALSFSESLTPLAPRSWTGILRNFELQSRPPPRG